jgi:opacity protein-like surface antigen
MGTIRMSIKLTIGAVLSALSLASAAHAQTLFNVRLGPTFASRETNQVSFESKSGMQVGGGGGFRLGSGPLTLNPSVIIVGKMTKTGSKSSGGENRLKLQYIEFPLLAALSIAPKHRISPFIEAGPVLDMETRCRVEFVTEFTKDEVGCDINTSETIDRHKIDFGVSAGAGFDFRMADERRLSLEGRYTHGFSNISASDDPSLTLRNRAVSIYLAYYFPFKPNV